MDVVPRAPATKQPTLALLADAEHAELASPVVLRHRLLPGVRADVVYRGDGPAIGRKVVVGEQALVRIRPAGGERLGLSRLDLDPFVATLLLVVPEQVTAVARRERLAGALAIDDESPYRRVRLGGGGRREHVHPRKRGSDHDCADDRRGGEDGLLPPLHELPRAVQGTRSPGGHRLVREVSVDVVGQRRRGCVAAGAVLLHRLHDDPVDVSAEELHESLRIDPATLRDLVQPVTERAQTGRRRGRVLLAEDAHHLDERGRSQTVRLEGGCPREQLVQQHAEGVDVAPPVHLEAAHLGLLGAHVGRRADELAVLREERPLGQPMARRLGDAEVDHLRDGHAVMKRDHHVGGLQVAVDDALRVRVVHGPAHVREELQPLARP